MTYYILLPLLKLNMILIFYPFNLVTFTMVLLYSIVKLKTNW
ncbi:hypothetical protein CLOHYLEM_06598 [[Clostridium] hylemonae DSM 15053]|uniref:Uncharacterized protein n=1 Tax=[Clostridium] hylemonae DSM 15053 TaxID=553973 RepID=C0C3D6_9FIRM|nr:hypothetical protein CLOHYLEM_06598 [[Clostridium] hylemonae DSM 15053]